MSEPEIGSASTTLTEGAARLGIELSDLQIQQFQSFCSLLLQANQRFNLTALKTPSGIMRTLFLDSLTIAETLPRELKTPGASVRAVDLGTGAGVPGLPLKILYPHWSMVLVESVQKKTRFVHETAQTLGLAGVSVVSARAEEVGRMSQYRDAADLSVARAVSALPALVELCAPLVRPEGLLVLPKSGDVRSEIRAAASAARAMKIELQEVHEVPAALGLGENRFIVVYRKMAATPAGYPRRVGLATSRPIGFEADSEPARPRAPRSRAESKQPRPPAHE